MRSRQVTWFLLAAWLLGFELAPGVHLAVHQLLAPHHHDGDAPADSTPESPDHGRHSLAHHGAATLAPAPFLFTPPPLPATLTPDPPPPTLRPLPLAPRSVRARGPPAPASRA